MVTKITCHDQWIFNCVICLKYLQSLRLLCLFGGVCVGCSSLHLEYARPSVVSLHEYENEYKYFYLKKTYNVYMCHYQIISQGDF